MATIDYPITYRIAKETRSNLLWEYKKVYYSPADVIRALRLLKDEYDALFHIRAYYGDMMIKDITYQN